MTTLDNFRSVQSQISGALKTAQREATATTLVAVSKTYGASAILPVLQAGHRVFGENRVQEAHAKWPNLRQDYPDIELHLIGPLQSNKAAEAVALFDVIQTIDRPKIAVAIAQEMQKQHRDITLLVQVNTGREPQKAGVLPEDLEPFLDLVRTQLHLTISGLMCIPAVDQDPTEDFQALADMAKRHGISLLSMGMSGDFKTAISCGATHVRVGSAIFGTRT
jgi:pyridoxal phosphate enzyme (YggS family)